MQYSVKQTQPERHITGCAIVGVFEKRRLSAAAQQLDKTSAGALARLLKRGDLEGRKGQTLLVPYVPRIAAERVLLVGLGPRDEFGPARYREVVGKAARIAADCGARDATLYLADLDVKGRDSTWKTRSAVECCEDALYRFEHFKGNDTPKRALKRLVINVADAAEHAAASRGLGQGLAIAAGVRTARELGNLPGNICTPSYLAEQAKALHGEYKGIKVGVLELADMEKLGMGALLSVARGSRQPPKLITLEYQGGGRSDPRVALVGKGITFDSGGISIKPAASMDEMKFDMCGAAAVLGAFRACAELALPVNLVGIIPSCENLPDGSASKPGDVVKSLSGQTIEVLNTDAEGRLILCDALTYSERFQPEVVIDMATLTGACVVALGKHPSGLFSNDAALADALKQAGETSGDRIWELPLWEDYQDLLKSNFADMANIGGRDAGAITAACFLARFTKKMRWAHLDIAGTAWKTGDQKGATGRPVPLIVQYLLDRLAV
jgi:leucyl aminopeptidase